MKHKYKYLGICVKGFGACGAMPSPLIPLLWERGVTKVTACKSPPSPRGEGLGMRAETQHY